MALNNKDCAALLKAVAYTAQDMTSPPISFEAADFGSVATTVAQLKRDDVLNAITQVVTKTLFRVADAGNAFSFMLRDSDFYSMWVRKLTPFISIPFHDPAFLPPCTGVNTVGESVDPFKIKKVRWIETHFQDVDRWYDYNTIFDKQFDGAFESESAFASFLYNTFASINTSHNLWVEAACRGTLLKAMAIKSAMQYPAGHVVHLISEYNNDHSTSFTKEDIMLDDNFLSFTKWAGARISKARNLMLRANNFATCNWKGDLTTGLVRSCREDDLCTVVLSKYAFLLDNVVKSSTFNPEFLSAASNVNTVDFWQKMTMEETVSVEVGTYDENNWIYHEDQVVSVQLENLIGVIFDRNCAGVAFDEAIVEAIRNPAGLYTDYHYHEGCKAMIDPTEKMVLLFLD